MQTKERKTSSYEEQRQRAIAFFAAIRFKVIMFIMLELSPTEPGSGGLCESGVGNTVMNVLYPRLTPS